MKRLFFCCLCVCVVGSFSLADEQAPPAPVAEGASAASPPSSQGDVPSVDFERDIRPIFATHCVGCHGPEKQKAGLRLDVKDDALRGSDSGPVIQPGEAVHSKLVALITEAEPGKVMPPNGAPLTADHVKLITAWIDAGATWPDTPPAQDTAPKSDHWAFKAPIRSNPPAVNDSAWIRNPIDAFILARLEKEGIKPSSEADRYTLIRRLSLDLIGLPPLPEEVDAFVNDPSPYAYEALVNRLLASPHFGERWGRHWLDEARYADSDGFEKDTVRPYAWRYRNWVIDALNRDLPFDQFTVLQLAGDLVPGSTTEDKVATGFHRNTLTNKEGGVDPEQFRVEQVVDRTNTTGAVFLGLTVACAQCHSHKYDPISQKEYYQLYAFFNTGMEKDIPAPLDPEVEAYKQAKASHEARQAELQKAIDAYKPELEASMNAWAAKQDLTDPEWLPLKPAGFISTGGATLTKQEDDSILVSGQQPARDAYTVNVTTDLTGVTAFRLETLTDASLPQNGPGRAADGNLVLTGFSVKAARPKDPGTTEPVPFAQAIASYSQDGFDVAGAIDDNRKSGWAIAPRDGAGVSQSAVFATVNDAGFSEGTIFTFTLDQQYQENYTIGRFRISATRSPRNLLQLPDEVRVALKTAPEQRTDAQKSMLLEYYGTLDSRMRELKAALDAHIKAAPQQPATQAQTIAENPTPPETHIHIRGDFLRPGDAVQAGTFSILPPLKPRGEKADRLDLARWLVDPANPLTARVTVNRMWDHLFGRGLVFTSNDFGTRGELPSHPELLDWLATEFIARGWSMKDMIRLIVTSATYRQSSNIREDLVDRDPLNVLLARQGRFRNEAEISRDLFLAASGLLNPAVGGPSVRPPLPKGVAELGYAGSVRWPESQGNDKYRRGLYIFFQRTVPYPMLMTFDCPDSNVTCIRRTRSNTPLQALTLLNDPVFNECAQALGRRILTRGGCDPGQRLNYAFRVCLSREPSDAELGELEKLLADQRAAFEQNPASASEAAGSSCPDGTTSAEAAAYTAVARVLMNLDEFTSRE
ncbi:MAG: DUF1553 domain-containing protein [Candidatus Hydrogenedentes bacterium]|nr:DUF1553 domain-containing protein [Candidatus Hydrogenedentota bacterium]